MLILIKHIRNLEIAYTKVSVLDSLERYATPPPPPRHASIESGGRTYTRSPSPETSLFRGNYFAPISGIGNHCLFVYFYTKYTLSRAFSGLEIFPGTNAHKVGETRSSPVTIFTFWSSRMQTLIISFQWDKITTSSFKNLLKVLKFKLKF